MGLILCIVVMSAALLLGGGTRSGFLGDVVLQLAAIPLLVFAIVRSLSSLYPPSAAVEQSPP